MYNYMCRSNKYKTVLDFDILKMTHARKEKFLRLTDYLTPKSVLDPFEAYNDISSATKIFLTSNPLWWDRTIDRKLSRHSRDILEKCFEDNMKS